MPILRKGLNPEERVSHHNQLIVIDKKAKTFTFAQFIYYFDVYLTFKNGIVYNISDVLGDSIDSKKQSGRAVSPNPADTTKINFTQIPKNIVLYSPFFFFRNLMPLKRTFYVFLLENLKVSNINIRDIYIIRWKIDPEGFAEVIIGILYKNGTQKFGSWKLGNNYILIGNYRYVLRNIPKISLDLQY